MDRMYFRFFVLTLFLLCLPSLSLAQEPPSLPTAPEVQPQAPASDVTLELSQEGQRPLMRLAFPDFERGPGITGAAAEATSVLESTLRSDLENARVFEMQGSWAFGVLELTGDRSRDFEQYRSLGNEFLLSGKVQHEAGRLVLEATLYDLAAGEGILGKRYRGSYPLARRIAHTFADEVLSYLTGSQGISMTSLAFVSDRDEAGRKEIYLMDYDGFNQRRLTAHRSTSLAPSWKPDSSGVGYTSFVTGVPGVYYADARSGRKATLSAAGRLDISPTFSPDGAKMAFSRSIEGNIDLMIADSDGSRPRRVTTSRSIDTNPAWSPTGAEIAFTSSRTGGPQVYTMDPEGTNVRRISFTGNYNDNAAWSPEGTRIAYSTRQDGRFQIAVTDVVTLETTVLTSGAGDHEDPTFSPDGRWIAFSRKQGASKQIWVIDSKNGSGLRKLTQDGNNEAPAWSPYPG